MADTLDPTWLEAALRARMPRRGANGRLALVRWSGKSGFAAEHTGENDGGLWACFQLVRLVAEAPDPEADEKHGSVGITTLIRSDDRQQSALRAEVYLDSWLSIVEEWLTVTPPDVILHAIPANLARAEVLGLARPQTAAEFREALLAPRRMGKLFGDGAALLRVLDAGR